MHHSDRRTCGGFTLVELVLVLTIAGVLAAVAVPRMVDRSAFQTHGSAAEIRTALRYAQMLALAKNREVCVDVNANVLSLTFDSSLNPVPPPGVCAPSVTRPGEGTLAYTVPMPANITLTPNMAFRFDGQGRPTSNLAVPWIAAVTFTVGGSAPVIVDAETGYVH
jgi:MSHA pilin protein MshC